MTDDEAADKPADQPGDDAAAQAPRRRPRPYAVDEEGNRVAAGTESDAGSEDAGSEDAGSEDAGSEDAAAETADAAPAPVPAEEPEPPAPRATAGPGVAVLVALAVAVAVFAAANIWLLLVRSNIDDVEAARGAAVASARIRIPALLTYKYTQVAEYVANAPNNATGQFKKDFTQLITRVIAPAAAKQQIVTTAQVKSVGVIDAHADSVTVLVMLDQTTTSNTTRGARVDGSRVRVVMTHTGGQWLVSGMTPI